MPIRKRMTQCQTNPAPQPPSQNRPQKKRRDENEKKKMSFFFRKHAILLFECSPVRLTLREKQ